MITMSTKIVGCEVFPMIFAAGPGTGKTTLCKEHVSRLRDEGYDVLCLSFTKHAASQLKVPGVESRTIDSFYYQWLKRYDALEGFSSRNFELLGKRFAEMFRHNSDFRRQVVACYEAVVIDEGQDCTKEQLRNLWNISEGNLQIFADIDQCIYEWRDAQPSSLLEMIENHNIEPLLLTHTHRLTKPVLEASRRLIWNNFKRFSIECTSIKNGPPIEYEETEYDIDATLRRLKEINSDDVAVLVRNARGREFLKGFWSQGLSRLPESHKPYAGTIHGAKGLEWRNVFIVRANRYEYKGPVEEERRVFYTAMTRSCNFLHITAFLPVCFIKEAAIGN